MAGEKTEKATPKKREDARKKGQIARSADFNGAVGLLAGLLALSAFGPGMVARIEAATLAVLELVRTPGVVDRRGIGPLLLAVGRETGLAVAPVLVVCALTALVVSVGQVGFKPSFEALKPRPSRLNPLSGFKNIFGPNAVAETVKNLAKVGFVGAIAALALFPQLHDLAAMVGTPAPDLMAHIAREVLHLAQRAAMAYLLIAVGDLLYQRHRLEKQLRMDKQELKEEAKTQDMPAEVRMARRRRAAELARARMMDAIPTADVVVTNPTHFSVALRYSSEQPAPVVVAKGADHVAFRIRELAREHGVAVVPDPPLARTLYATVDVGRQIPEDLFQAVAQLLAFVYRVAGAARAGVAA